MANLWITKFIVKYLPKISQTFRLLRKSQFKRVCILCCNPFLCRVIFVVKLLRGSGVNTSVLDSDKTEL